MLKFFPWLWNRKKRKIKQYDYCPHCFRYIKGKKNKNDSRDYMNRTLCEEHTFCFYCNRQLTFMAYSDPYNAWDDKELMERI